MVKLVPFSQGGGEFLEKTMSPCLVSQKHAQHVILLTKPVTVGTPVSSSL